MPEAAHPPALSYLTLLGAVAPVFTVVLCGFLVRRAGWLTAEADRSLLSLTVNVLTPCLILDSLLGNTAVQHAGNLVLAPMVGFVTVAGGYGTALGLARWLGICPGKERRTFAFATGLYNYGYIPLPLIAFLYGTGTGPGRDTTAVLFAHNLGTETALWTVGILVLTSGSAGWRCVLNVPSLAILAALLLNLAGARDWLPSFLTNSAHLAGGAAIPIGLLMTGASFADLLQGKPFRGGWNVALGAVLLRLLLLPAAFLLLARWLPCPIELKRVMVLQAAMPAAVAPVILSRHFNGDPEVAANVVLTTSAVGLLTIPFWIDFGMRFVFA